MRARFLFSFSILAAAFVLGGCQAAMYRAYESFGIEKRDLLVDRVEDARDAQSEAKDQFTSALDQFRSVVEVDGGDLERTYDRVNAEYERSAARASDVRKRIDAVERVAEDLFAEWQDELEEYTNPTLKRDSERLLKDTRRRYSTLIQAMRRAEKSMDPVLNTFRDQVLVLKHNLNARAIGALRKELTSIERQTAALMKEMEKSIAEANEFIKSMQDRGDG